MKILLISGTNHKGSTYHIGRMLMDRLSDSEEDKKEIFLPAALPEFCCGCANCFMKSEELCPHYGFTKPITESIDEADVLILTSPVYVFHASGQMKVLLDHYGYRWMVHRPCGKMFTKQAVCIATAAGGGMRSTLKDMKDSLFFWGLGRTYAYGKAVAAISWNEVRPDKKRKIEEDMQVLARRIAGREGHVTPSLKTRALFSVMRLVQKRGGLNPADRIYWQETGWLGNKRPWKNGK